MNESVVENIKNIIERIRPYLNSDGGDINFINYEDGIVFVKLTGACGGCAYRNETIKNGVLKTLQEEILEIKDVINVEI